MRKRFYILGFLLFAIITAAVPVQKAAANYGGYTWLLLSWKDKSIACTIKVEHDGNPSNEEIKSQCSEAVYQEWISAPPCKDVYNSSKCEGYYLLLGEKPVPTLTNTPPPATATAIPTATLVPTATATIPPNLVFVQPEANVTPIPNIETNIFEPEIEIALLNCSHPEENRCDSIPQILLHGKEKSPGHKITKIEGFYDSQYFLCNEEWCVADIKPSKNATGDTFEFWASSTTGIVSKHYRILINFFQTTEENQHYWELHLLSRDYTLNLTKETLLAKSWSVLPLSANSFPIKMQNPKFFPENTGLFTSPYLAARLINMGMVAPSKECPKLISGVGGVATECGVVAAQQAMLDWQTKQNQVIFDYAVFQSIPPQLLKNVLDYDSSLLPQQNRFWDMSLSQLNENGAFYLSLWLPSFFQTYCPTAINPRFCQGTINDLGGLERKMVLNAMIGGDKKCAYCPYGCSATDYQGSNVEMMSWFLVASGREVGDFVANLTNKEPGKIINYADLWRLTLYNYYDGMECLAPAIQNTANVGLNLTWENIKYNMTPACFAQTTVVEKIIQ